MNKKIQSQVSGEIKIMMFASLILGIFTLGLLFGVILKIIPFNQWTIFVGIILFVGVIMVGKEQEDKRVK